MELHERCRDLGKPPATGTSQEGRQDPRPYYLSQSAAVAREISDLALAPAADLANRAALLLRGDAGTGKTHLLCDTALRGLSEGCAAIVLLGEAFAERRDPWAQIREMLDLSCSRDAFLGALNTAGEASGRRALFLIDALNEAESTSLWRTHLPAMLAILRPYPWIAFAVTVRWSYETDVAPDSINSDVLVRATHHGFAAHEYEAAKTFFHHYGIKSPAVPLLTAEFQNPLFLSLFCKGLRAAGRTDVPEGFHGITTVFSFLLGAVNEKLSKREVLDFDPASSPVRDAVGVLVEAMRESGEDWVPRAQARERVDAVLPRDGWNRSLFRHLIAEGILTLDRFPSGGAGQNTTEEAVRFAYERLSDHMIVDAILAAIAALEPDGRSEALSDLATELRRDIDAWKSGRIEAVAIQLPERLGLELPDVVTDRRGHDIVVRAVINSIGWRRHNAFTEATRTYINQVLNDDENAFPAVLEAMLSVASTPGHPYNAVWLDRMLRSYPLADRDAWWSIFLYRQYGEHGAVDRHVAWAWSEDTKDHIDDPSVLLAGITLSWFLTTSHRYLRDRATKALVRLLAPRLHILAQLLRRFAEIDDMYIQERLYAVAYGAAMRTVNTGALEQLARQVYHDIFSDGTPPPHILLRDHARGVVECAAARGIVFDERQLTKARPPYTSGFPGLPDAADVAKYDVKGDDRWDLRWAQHDIVESVTGFGDFARYVIGTNSGRFDWTGEPLRSKRPRTSKQLFDGFRRRLTKRQRAALDAFADACRHRDIRFLMSGLADASQLVERRNETHEAAEAAERAFRRTLTGAKLAALDTDAMPYIRDSRERRPKFDVAGAQRWTLQRVFELGWTLERFGAFDRSQRLESRDGRAANKPERMGKKYQWLAWHEMLARIADNFRYAGDLGQSARYEGPWQGHDRDIDPSLLLVESRSEQWIAHTNTWWFPVRYQEWGTGVDDATWLADTDSLPDARPLLEIRMPDGTSGLVLDTFVTWRAPTPVEDTRGIARREVQYAIDSFIVRSRDLAAIVAWGIKQKFWGRSMPKNEQLYRVHLGEFHWAPAYRYETRQDPRHGWTKNGLPVSVIATTEGYLHESGNFDCSIDDGVSLHLPSRWLVEKMALRWNGEDGRWFTTDGKLAMEDPTAREVGPSAFVASRDPLVRFLDDNDLAIVWALGGERRAVYPIGELHGAPIDLTGFFWLTSDGEIKGSVRALSTGEDDDPPKRSRRDHLPSR